VKKRSGERSFFGEEIAKKEKIVTAWGNAGLREERVGPPKGMQRKGAKQFFNPL